MSASNGGKKHNFLTREEMRRLNRDQLEDLVLSQQNDLVSLERAAPLDDEIEALRQSEYQYRVLLNSIDKGYSVIEVLFDNAGSAIDYRFIKTNAAFEQLSGLVNAVGKTMKELSPSHEKNWFKAYGTIAKTGKPRHFINQEIEPGCWYDVYAFRYGQPEAYQVASIYNDITTRKKTEDALVKSEERFSAVCQYGSAGIALADLGGKLEYVNPAFCKMLGYEANDLIGMNFKQITFENDLSVENKLVIEVLDGKRDHYEIDKRYLRKDGNIIWVRISGSVIRDAMGKPTQELLMVRDITERKQAEEALWFEREQLQVIFNNMSTGIIVMDNKGTVIAFNKTALVWHGFKSNSEIWAHLPQYFEEFDFLDKEGNVIPIEEWPASRAVKRDYVKDFIATFIRKKTGDSRWISYTVIPIHNADHEVVRLLIELVDITGRKQAEDAEAAAHRLTQSIIDNTTSVVYAFDLEGRFLLANTAIEKMFNSTQKQLIGKKRHEFMPKKDADWHEENDHQIIKEGRALEFEEYYQLNDRSITWLTTKFPLLDTKGRIYAVGGISTDISQRKKAEEELYESEQRYRLFFESSPFALFITEPFSLTNPNPSAEKMFGASAQELGEMKPWEVFPETQPDGTSSFEKAKCYTREALAGKPQLFEWRHKRKDGILFDSEVALVRIYLKGKPKIVVTIIDVTEHKRALEQLKSSLREKEILLQEIYHRTKNNMGVISSFLELQAATIQNPKLDHIVEDTTSRIRTMALAHEMLYKSKSLTRINMRDYITELAQLIMIGSRISPVGVCLRYDIEEVKMLIDTAIPMGLIINELLTNCFKHAFTGERMGTVDIGLHRTEDNCLEFILRDDGVGLPQGLDITKATTLGVQLVFQITRHQLHGTVDVKTDNGLRWSIHLPENLYNERI
ncbi:MAG TPA: PAS domain S-box protein [Chitinispirillaceae bacterium]|nr:PAS domain S-box protein [Chitinispirillaceae bacterium]